MDKKNKHILKNVGELYMKYGIRSVTMDDIASEFGISKKTLYQLFKDKEDLVNQVFNYFMENPMFELTMNKKGNAIDKLFSLRKHIVTVLKSYNNNLEFDLKKYYPALYKKVIEFKKNKIFEDSVQNIKEGISQGLFRDGLEVEFIAKLQVGRMLCTYNPNSGIFGEDELSLIELFDKGIDYHLHAICTEEGLKYYHKQLNNIKNEKNN